MAKKKPRKGMFDWCIKQADAYGVSYGVYMADYYEQDMYGRKEKAKCCNQNLKG